MTGLEVRDLNLAIRGKPILHGVSLSVAPGEIVAITGESGSGKSMTAFSIMRLLPEGAEVTEGGIALDGEDLLALSEARMCRVRGGRIGMVFQEPMTALNPVFTVGRQLTEGLRLHMDMDKAEANARAIELRHQRVRFLDR